MTMTRTAIAALLASTLLVVPAEAGWKMRVLKGVAIGVGGYMLGQATAKAADNEEDMLQTPDSVLQFDELDDARQTVERTVETVWDLIQYRGMGGSCRATEQYQADFYRYENTDGAFAGQWHNCCVSPSGKVLQSTVLVLQQLPFLGGMKAPDAAEDALAAFVDEALNYGEILDDIYEIGKNSESVAACRSVMNKDLALQ